MKRLFSRCGVALLLPVLASCSDEPAEVGHSVLGLGVADCPAGYRVIMGTSGNDSMNGTSGNDCILGLDGRDSINGLGGNDFILGGAGDDVVFGGNGNDTLYGEAGADVLHGEAGTDLIYGGDGDDTATGDASADTMYGDSGRDLLSGGDANDIIYGGADADLIHGDNGNDMLDGQDGDDVLDGDANNDALWGGPGDDVLYGDLANDILHGEEGDDALIGGAGTNTEDGGDGTDACGGSGCEKPRLVPSGCTSDVQCTTGLHCITDFGLCFACVTDQDGDGVCDSKDACAADPLKSAAGLCGCGVKDTDSDADTTPDCRDGCPLDPDKVSPAACGCGLPDLDSDNDGHLDCVDLCPGFDDQIDVDANGVPDACQIPTGCTADSIGVGVLRGSVYIYDYDYDGYRPWLDGITCITGDVYVGEASTLTALANVTHVAGNVEISGTQHLTNLDGLENLVAIGGNLQIGGNALLRDLAGLEQLEQLGELVQLMQGYRYLRIANNPVLPSCWAQELARKHNFGPYGTTIGGNTGTGSCGALPADFACVPGAAGLGVYDGSIYINGTYPRLEDLGGYACITGDIFLFGAVSDLSALSSLEMVGGSLMIGDTQLEDLRDLHSLRKVNGSLMVYNNTLLAACDAWQLGDQVGLPCNRPGYAERAYCKGNTGVGSCGALPSNFACVPGAHGPGVFDGALSDADGLLGQGALGGLTCVTGDVTLWGSTGRTDMRDLSQLQFIGGDLLIAAQTALQSVTGLEALSVVGGHLVVQSNPALRDVRGLSHLTKVLASRTAWDKAVSITNNPALPPCQVWDIAAKVDVSCAQQADGSGATAACTGNAGTESCGSLPDNFACVPGARGPGVYDGNVRSYTFGDVLADFHGVTCITGELSVGDRADLAPLSQLQKVGGRVAVSYASSSAFEELSRLSEVGAELFIAGNPQLTSLRGLRNLTSVGNYLTIQSNSQLPACFVWDLAQRVGVPCPGPNANCDGNRGSGSCGTLPNDFVCAPGARGPGVYDGAVNFGSMLPANSPDVGGVTCITGDLHVAVSTLTDFSVLSTLQMVGGDVHIQGNSALTSLDGLENVTSVRGALMIEDNAALSNLYGLGNLSSVAGNIPGSTPQLYVAYNSELPACWPLQMEAQVGLTCGWDENGAFVPCAGNLGTGGCAH